MSCGSTLWNPFCLASGPTDPYSWFFYNNTWTYATQWTSGTSYSISAGVWYNGRVYVCTAGLCASDPTTKGWSLLTSLQPAGAKQLECTSTGPPQPNPQSGVCERTPLSGPDAACVNPCTRLANGRLAVNKNTTQCRVFPNAVTSNTASGCPTVCPSTCVELWETCPPGTAPMSTLIQTKTVDDLMSLAGPLRQDGAPNILWPTNYAAGAAGSTAIGGKPYTECYSYNTEFCELPMARQETSTSLLPIQSPMGQSGGPTTVCFSTCPPGTIQDATDPYTCLFVPRSGIYDPSTYGPTTPVQQVFCNPQYFNPAYWAAPNAGLQKGCVTKPLPAKQGSTCPAGTSPILNENFNLEWCMPECPANHYHDLTQSTCIATCEGSSPDNISSANSSNNNSGYNVFQDYVDFYATTGRCATQTYTNGSTTYTQELDCAQNYTEGRCPALHREPKTSETYAYDYSTDAPHDVGAKHSSVNKQCSERRYKDFRNGAPASSVPAPMPREAYSAWKSHYDGIQQYQAAHPNGPNKLSSKYSDGIPGANTWGECPAGMTFGDAACLENVGFCYDECMDGYEPVAFCSNGSSTCGPEGRVYACRALCPKPEEGLGPWAEVNASPLHTCAYQYPQGVPPTDPNLWASCPDDGRYFLLQNSPSDLSVAAAAASRKEPLCVRTMYLRQSTCPIGFNASGGSCVQACDASEAVVTLADGSVKCQNVPQTTSRHDIDLIAVSDASRAKSEFRSRVLKRKTFLRSTGTDPNAGLEDPNGASNSFLDMKLSGAVSVGAALVGLFFLLKK